jgi:hypothetical protein
MMKSFDLATADRREMLLDKDRLHAIGLQHQPSWATGNLLRDMQTPPKAAAPAKAAAAKPAAAAAPAAATDEPAAPGTAEPPTPKPADSTPAKADA